MSDTASETTEKTSKGKEIVDGVEQKIASTFPWLKASLGGFWTIFWIIIAITIEAIIVLIPILLAIAGILFIIGLFIATDGMIDFVPWSGTISSDDKDKKD